MHISAIFVPTNALQWHIDCVNVCKMTFYNQKIKNCTNRFIVHGETRKSVCGYGNGRASSGASRRMRVCGTVAAACRHCSHPASGNNRHSGGSRRLHPGSCRAGVRTAPGAGTPGALKYSARPFTLLSSEVKNHTRRFHVSLLCRAFADHTLVACPFPGQLHLLLHLLVVRREALLSGTTTCWMRDLSVLLFPCLMLHRWILHTATSSPCFDQLLYFRLPAPLRELCARPFSLGACVFFFLLVLVLVSGWGGRVGGRHTFG